MTYLSVSHLQALNWREQIINIQRLHVVPCIFITSRSLTLLTLYGSICACTLVR